MAASPACVARAFLIAVGQPFDLFVLFHPRSIRKLKKPGGRCCRPWFYLSLDRANAFPGHARGDRVRVDLWPEPWTIRPEDPLPRPCVPSTTSMTNDRMGCPAGSIARNGYVAQFSFFGSNTSPFFQIVNAIDEIFRASVSRAISLRMPRSCNPCRYWR